jgi:hypothetical protein
MPASATPQATDPDDAKDPRRGLNIEVERVPSGDADHPMIYLKIDGELWCELEWSPKRLVWCIQDAEGRCLTHAESTHATAESMEAAIEVGKSMVRDGTIPTPELARRQLKQRQAERRAKRDAQPSVAKKNAERKALFDEWRQINDQYGGDDFGPTQLPMLEAIFDALDVKDPDIWRSNSFSILREKLVAQAVTEVARFKMEINRTRQGRAS